MNLLSAENLSKSYGSQVLFQELTLGIGQGQKIGLIARNGSGKSSLLKILAGKDQPDEGLVSLRKDIRITYLEQEPEMDPQDTVFDTLFYADTPMLKAIRAYEQSLETGDATTMGKAMEAMDALNAWDYETRIKQMLSQLNIHQLQQSISELSGGQRKRVALARALLSEPDLMILDEPTNHLDVQMITWLEEFLARQTVTLLLVTHDRYFLDRVCNEIVELDRGKLYSYKGNYSYFLEKKQERELQQQTETEKAKNLYRKELEWVRRQPKARTTKAKYRLDAFEELKEKAHQHHQKSEMQIEIKTSRLGTKILELHKVSKQFDTLQILDNFSYIFRRKERIGIVGKNGAGKSTFLNLLMGLEQPNNGKIVTGETVNFGYFTQGGLSLKEDQRVIEVIKDIAEVIPLAKGRQLTALQLLLHFQFPADMHYNYVSTLSGGEKRKLYLLTILMKNPNFLILDEPTNDLDIDTLRTLEDFLEDFPGCLIVVSHDRYFTDKLADHLFVFEGDGMIRDYYGRYSDYLEEKKQEAKAEAPKEKPAPVAKKAEPTAKKRLSYKEQREYNQLEEAIGALEEKKEVLTAQLLEQASDHEALLKTSQELEEVIHLIDEKTDRWLELSERAG